MRVCFRIRVKTGPASGWKRCRRWSREDNVVGAREALEGSRRDPWPPTPGHRKVHDPVQRIRSRSRRSHPPRPGHLLRGHCRHGGPTPCGPGGGLDSEPVGFRHGSPLVAGGEREWGPLHVQASRPGRPPPARAPPGRRRGLRRPGPRLRGRVLVAAGSGPPLLKPPTSPPRRTPQRLRPK